MKYRRFRVFDIILVVLTLLFSVVITSGDITINYHSDDGPFDPMASPTATTEEATGVAGYNATLQGTLTSDGGESCITGFEYGLDTSYGTNVTTLPTYIYAGGATTLKIFKYWVSNMTKNAETVSYGGIIYALAEDDTYIYAGGATNFMVKQYYKSNMTLKASSASYGGTIYALAEDDTYIYAGGATNQSTKQYYKSNMTLKANTVSYGGDIRAIVEDSEYIYVAGVLTNRVRQYWKSNMTYKAQTVALLPGAASYGLAEDENYIYVGGETNLVSQFWKSNMTWKANTSTSYGDIVKVIAIDDTYIYVGGGTQMTVKQYWKSNMTYKAQTPSYGWTTNSIAVDSTHLYVGETTGNTVRQYYKYNLALKASTASYGGATNAISSLTEKYATGYTFSFNSTGLTPLTTYHYRAYAINSAGKSVGDDKTFTTTSTTPIVTTNSATGITSTNATLQGTLTQDGGEPCNVSFEYGITTSYGTNSTIQTNKLKDAIFSFDATGLIPLQLYHYRTYANNSIGGVTGEDKTFTTLNPPIVYVDDDAAPGWYDVAHVHTIQQGVTNVSNGGTIYVYGGTYPETLVSSSYITIASKNLTIIGEQADMPKIRPLMSNSSAQNIFLFSGSGYTLTLQYLNISNYWGGGTTALNNGISMPAQNNLIVDNCILHDVNQIMTCYGNTTLTNSTAYNFKYYVFYGTWSGATYGLELICKYNTFYDSVFTVWSSSSAIIKPRYGHWYGDISYNYLAGGRIGIWIDPEPGLVCKFGGNWTIAHNTIDSRYNPANSDNISQGISFTSITGNFDKIDCRDNIINGANHYSIYHGGFVTGEPVATNTIVKNSIFNNSYWLYFPYAPTFEQKRFQWNGTGYSEGINYTAGEIHPVAGWTNTSTPGYMFDFQSCSITDPMFNLTGAPGAEYWGLRYGSPAVGTASDGGNIGAWQGTPTGGASNQPPLFSNETPSNGSAGHAISFNWNITIQDPDSATFNWTIESSNGDSNSLNDDTNGSKELTISGLSYSTSYTVWVNATDGTDWTREWFTFTTMDNTPPSFGTPTPTNGSTDQEISLTWQIPINDPNGDLLDWSIECSNSDVNSSNGDSNGSKELDISGLSYSTEYTIWVNATDGTNWTRQWFTFTTRGGTMSIYINQTGWNANCLSGENVSTVRDWALLQNTGDLAVDVSIEGTNTTAWSLEASPAHNQFKMQWGAGDANNSENFTIVILPDTQHYFYSEPANDIFTDQTQWIVENKDKLNIVYVGQLGDIIDGVAGQWELANESMSLLENPVTTGLPDGIPYSLIPGNGHEVAPGFNSIFGFGRFLNRSYYGGHYGDTNDNNYVLFNASGRGFIVVGLPFDEEAHPDQLSWANTTLQNYTDRRAIVISHYIVDNGAFSTQGQETYDALKYNPNLFLMLSGHTKGYSSRNDTYAGNRVDSLESDFSGLYGHPDAQSGFLRIMTFCPTENKIEVTTYSPHRDLDGLSPWYMNDSANKFTLTYDMTEDDANWTNIGTSPTSFIGNLAYGNSQPFGLKLFMPTSSSTTATQTSTLTFIATPS